ncbi:MAG TPA: hypothetical protein VMG41_00280 [Gemmatimonadales bacterium]|nr:hypothetical protein [Gemmatimonadales bacterium]
MVRAIGEAGTIANAAAMFVPPVEVAPSLKLSASVVNAAAAVSAWPWLMEAVVVVAVGLLLHAARIAASVTLVRQITVWGRPNMVCSPVQVDLP